MTSPGKLIKANSYNYRPDVDGLRALAILPVLLFHANLACPGGFVGVDVFFVISGFLITSLILKELAKGEFTLADFWERRIRRIFPANIVVVLSIIVAGWFLYLPVDFLSMGKSVLAQALLMSNVYFAIHTGYFEDASDTKPMLHTWSLAVEEQFYIVFPLLLIYLVRSKKLSIFATIATIGVVSLVMSVYGTYVRPDATFFILPTRAWELIIGSLLAAMPAGMKGKAGANEALGLLGLGLILFSIFAYGKDTRFPGLAALPPCIGAALIIFSGGSKPTLVGKILSWKPIVFIGLISYSLYLWHWPVLVYTKYVTPGQQSWQMRCGLLLLSIVMATLSLKFVETPFRKRILCPRRSQIFALAGLSVATVLLLGLGIVLTHGMPSRLSAKASHYAEFKNSTNFLNEITPEEAQAGKFAELGSQGTNKPIDILIWGDSHAMSMTPAVDELCRKFSVRGIEATHSSTAPLLGYESKSSFSLREKSPVFSKAVVDFIREKHIKKVFITAAWTSYGPPQELDGYLTATVKAVQEAGAKVYVLKDVPIPDFDVPRIAALTEFRGRDVASMGIPGETYRKFVDPFEFIFDHLSKMGVVVMNTPKYFLGTNDTYQVVRDDKVLYRDWHHLSIEGAKLLVPMLEPVFEAD